MHNQLEVVPNNKLAVADKWVSAEIALAKSYYTDKELTRAQIQVYALEIADIAREVGIERAHEAVVTACRTYNFFPSIAQIRDCAGLNPAKLLAVAQDRAWAVARSWVRKYYQPSIAGYRSDVPIDTDYTYQFSVQWKGHELPQRIEYAAEAAGGWRYLQTADPKDLVFARRQFDAGFERFPMSDKCTPENEDPFSRGVTDEWLLRGELVDLSGNPLPDGVGLITEAELKQRKDEAERAEAERRTARRAARYDEQEQLLSVISTATGINLEPIRNDVLGAIRYEAAGGDIRSFPSFAEEKAAAELIAARASLYRGAAGSEHIGWRKWFSGNGWKEALPDVVPDGPAPTLEEMIN